MCDELIANKRLVQVKIAYNENGSTIEKGNLKIKQTKTKHNKTNQ